eukprot:UN13135
MQGHMSYIMLLEKNGGTVNDLKFWYDRAKLDLLNNDMESLKRTTMKVLGYIENKNDSCMADEIFKEP